MALYDSEDIVQIAQAVQPYLDDLLGEGAEETSHELDRLLKRAAAGEDVDNLLVDALRRRPESRAWMQEALEPVGGVRRSYGPLPGMSRPVPATTRYGCPAPGCDFVWVRRHAGLGIPPCPRHMRDLLPAD